MPRRPITANEWSCLHRCRRSSLRDAMKRHFLNAHQHSPAHRAIEGVDQTLKSIPTKVGCPYTSVGIA
jgi:hypothetical protein